MTPFSVFPLKTMCFQMSPFSNHSTLNTVFKCLRFRSFSMETPTQKRRHSTPFSYENGVMETGPNYVGKQLYDERVGALDLAFWSHLSD